jgi:hypothetical protein
VCDDLNLSLSLLGDLDDVTEISNTAVDLDLVVQELLEGRDIEDLVAGGLRSVDDKLRRFLVADSQCNSTGILLRHTFFVTLACLPLGPDFYIPMILAYCITPQPQRGGPTAKHIHIRTVAGAIMLEVVAKK